MSLPGSQLFTEKCLSVGARVCHTTIRIRRSGFVSGHGFSRAEETAGYTALAAVNFRTPGAEAQLLLPRQGTAKGRALIQPKETAASGLIRLRESPPLCRAFRRRSIRRSRTSREGGAA
jgi:hypothetical protein